MLEDKLFQGVPNISETYRSEVQLWGSKYSVTGSTSYTLIIMMLKNEYEVYCLQNTFKCSVYWL